MLRRFLKFRVPEIAPPPEVPPGDRVYAIGDVHGRLDLLDRLLDDIKADHSARGPARVVLVFLGDLVDRGPDSAGVVERVRALAATSVDVRLLLGNHEEVFLAALDGDISAIRMFCRIGGRETALSYGLSPSVYEAFDHDELGAALKRVVPAEHRAFLQSATDMETLGDYVFVHAGIDPARTLDDQSAAHLRWMREPFLSHRTRLEKMVVHGHTITPDVEYHPHRIGIDTGAYTTGRLTALGLEGARRWTLHTV